MKKALIIGGSLVALSLIGCPKPPPPVVTPPESSSSVFVEPSSSSVYIAPSSSSVFVDSAAIKRQRLQGLMDQLMGSDIYFDYDDAALTTEGRDLAQKAADILLGNKNAFKVVLEGHTDERGSDDYNLALGNRRAITVFDYLRKLGVAAADLSTLSKGESEPKVEGTDEAAWSQNRRVHFSVEFK